MLFTGTTWFLLFLVVLALIIRIADLALEYRHYRYYKRMQDNIGKAIKRKSEENQ